MTDIGSIIDGRYHIDVELGRGAFGAVYRARQRSLDVDVRDVALKLFHEKAVGAEQVTDKLNDAITLIRLLDAVDDLSTRQHFINVYDLGVTRDPDRPQAFVAMELVRGGPLAHRVRDYRKFTARGPSTTWPRSPRPSGSCTPGPTRSSTGT